MLPWIDRRAFLRKLTEGVFFATVARWFPLRTSVAQAAQTEPVSGISRIVSVYNPHATDQSGGKDNENLNAGIVQEMVDQAILAFTGQSTLEAAWADIIPDPSRKVAIKINCQITGVFTKAKVVQPIVDGLLQRGVPADNIIIYDMRDNAFAYAGFQKNLGAGVKVGTVADFGGYARFLFDRLANLLTGGYRNSIYNYLENLGRTSSWWLVRFVCRSFLEHVERPFDCAYLINVPVLKALDGYSGVTLSMKNHYGSIGNPSEHHDDIMEHIPYINSLPPIREKTRLIVLDAIFAEYKWVNGRDQSYVAVVDKILVGRDPVAIDYLGWQMLEGLRNEYEVGPVCPNPVFIAKAAKIGLGIDDPTQIEFVEIGKRV